jgi:hypothetical protein
VRPVRLEGAATFLEVEARAEHPSRSRARSGSPVDLIPDFIPVLGHLDDIVLVPLGIWVTFKLTPRDVWAECEAESARGGPVRLSKDWRGAVLVAALWLSLLAVGLAILRLVS